MWLYAVPSLIFFVVNILIIALLLRIIEFNELSLVIVTLIGTFGVLNLLNGLIISASGADVAYVLGSIHGLLVIVSTGLVLYFILIFPKKLFRAKYDNLVRVLCFLPAAVFVLFFFTGTYITGVEKTLYGYREVFGLEFQAFSVCAFVSTICFIVYYLAQYRKAKRVTKRKIVPILFGILVILVSSQITFAVLGPETGLKMSYPPVGVWAGTVWGVVIYYSVRRYSMLRFTPGRTYVAWDAEYKTIHAKLEPLLEAGYRCLLFTRHNPKFLADKHASMDVVWISSQDSESSIPPKLEHIWRRFEEYVKTHPGDSILVFDVFDYLATHEGDNFKPALGLLRKMIDNISVTGNILIVPISAKSFDEQQKSHITKSGIEVLKNRWF